MPFHEETWRPDYQEADSLKRIANSLEILVEIFKKHSSSGNVENIPSINKMDQDQQQDQPDVNR